MATPAGSSRQEQRWLTPVQRRLIFACTAAVGVVAAYKVYRSERLKATHKALQTAADTLARYNDAASSVGQIAAVLADDIKAFLSSDSDEVPQSLRQLAKLARCQDVQDTLAACVASGVKGLISSSSLTGEPSIVDKVIDAVLSDRGQTLVGLAVRTAAQQSTDSFCNAVRQGLEAALQASGLGQQQQQQQQQQHHPSPASPGAVGMFYSAASSPAASPQQHAPYRVQTYTAYAGTTGSLNPMLGTLLGVLNSPQLLQAVDGFVSTCVGSTVGAYLSTAGSTDNMLATALHTLAQPSNKQLVIDIMSQVSAAFCREMAAACVAPAAAVASRPSSRLSDTPFLLEQQQQEQQLPMQRQLSAPLARTAPAGTSSSAAGRFSPNAQQDAAAAAALLHHSVSEGALSHSSDTAAAAACAGGSEPSSPQSGPSTPEPSVAAAAAADASAAAQQAARQSSYSSFAGSAVAGLILRRRSLGALLSGGAGGAAGAAAYGRGGSLQQSSAAAAVGPVGAGGQVLVDPALLGPLSTAVSLFVQAARFQEFRSLMVDVTRSSTREFVHSLLPRGWVNAVKGSRNGGAVGGSVGSSVSSSQVAAVTAALQRVYTAMSVVLLLLVYAMSPKVLLLGESS